MKSLSVLLLASSLGLFAGPVPCEVKAHKPFPIVAITAGPSVGVQAPDVGPAPKADVTPPQLNIGGANEWPEHKIVRLAAQGVPEKAGKKWKITPLDDPKTQIVDWATGRDVIKLEWTAPPGRYMVTLTVGWIDKDGAFHLDETELPVLIKGRVPTPLPDPKVDPPGPPNPPTPKPGGPLRAIIISDDDGRYTRDQVLALNSTRVRAYLDRKAVTVNGRPEWRWWDPDQVITNNESATMRAMWDSTRPSLNTTAIKTQPQIAIAVGDVGQLFPITTEDQLLGLLKKHGGE